MANLHNPVGGHLGQEWLMNATPKACPSPYTVQHWSWRANPWSTPGHRQSIITDGRGKSHETRELGVICSFPWPAQICGQCSRLNPPVAHVCGKHPYIIWGSELFVLVPSGACKGNFGRCTVPSPLVFNSGATWEAISKVIGNRCLELRTV
jgi:hypothetical protein